MSRKLPGSSDSRTCKPNYIMLIPAKLLTELEIGAKPSVGAGFDGFCKVSSVCKIWLGLRKMDTKWTLTFSSSKNEHLLFTRYSIEHRLLPDC